MTIENQVADLSNEVKPQTVEAVQGTGGAAGSVTTQPLPDAGSDNKLEVLEKTLQAREQDINKLKSTYDKQMAQTKKQFEEQQRQLEEELRKVKMSGMTDEQKTQFERQLELEQAQQWREEALRLKREKEEAEISANYAQYFIENGVPKEKLITNAGVDALVQSGWEGITHELNSLKTKVSEYEKKLTQGTVLEQPQANQPQQPIQQRSPITDTPSPTSRSWTWTDVIDKYGSVDEYFNKVERQEISPVPLVQPKR